MRILILGKNGLLGHELQKVFANEDFVALNSKELDVTDREKVFETFMTIQPDFVVNATGYTNVDLAEKEVEKAHAVNGYAVGVLAAAAREIDATFIHFSTDYVFNGNHQEGYKEEDGTAPLNAYGLSKELGEKLLIEEMELEHENIPQALPGRYFLIRTQWLYGKHGKNFVNTMLTLGEQQLIRAKETGVIQEPLKVVNDQWGNPTYALDLALQAKWLTESREYPYGIYHITNTGTTNWYEYAKTIFDLKKLPVDVVPCASNEYSRPAVRPQYSALINTKLPPLRSWKEALEEYLLS